MTPVGNIFIRSSFCPKYSQTAPAAVPLINHISLSFFSSNRKLTKMLSTVKRQQPLVKMLLQSSILTFIILNIHHVNGQSNYASHANNINYIGKGLPEETVLDGKVSGHWTLFLYFFFFIPVHANDLTASRKPRHVHTLSWGRVGLLVRNGSCRGRVKNLSQFISINECFFFIGGYFLLQVTKLDDLSPIIFLNRTKAALNCAAGSMQVSMT